jgi:hypothetical protein
VTLLCLCLAGCAAPASEPTGHLVMMRLPSADSLVRQAFAHLFDTKTGEFTETMTARAGAATLVRTTTGQFDLEALRASMSTEYSASSPQATWAVLGHAVELPSLAQRLVRDSSVMYLTKPSWSGSQRGRWMRYEGQWLGGLGRQWSDAVGPPWDPDFDMTDPAPTPLMALPQKMVDGGTFLPSTADVARYQFNVPVSEARQVIGASTPAGGTGTGAATGTPGPGEQLPVRVDVGRDGYIAGIHLDATHLVEQALGKSATGAGAQGIQYSYDLVLRRLGEPVDIALPPEGTDTSGGLWVQDLPAGSCLAADANRMRHLFFAPVGCDAAHRYEVYARVVLGTDIDPYPGPGQLEQLARKKCAEEFGRFVGVPPADSSLQFWTAAPAEGVWLQGGHQAPCVLDPGRAVTGSLRDSQR